MEQSAQGYRYAFLGVKKYDAFIVREKKTKKYAGVKVFICLLVAIVVLMALYVLHYNYSALAIWCLPCLLVAIAGIEVCLAEYIIILCVGNRKKYVVE